jgi:hypothetical protein
MIRDTPTIDHLIVAARTLDAIRERLYWECGFGLVAGGPRSDGLTQHLVPFDAPHCPYLEVYTVHDERLAKERPNGRTLLDATTDGPAALLWAAAVPDAARTAARLRVLTGEDPGLRRGASVRADGERLPWTEAGMAAARRRPCLPFFQTWHDRPTRRARLPRELAAAGHRCTPLSYTALEVETTVDDLDAWLGTPAADLGVRVRRTASDRPVAATIATDAGPVRLGFDR